MLKDEKTKRPMTPMLEGLLTGNVPPKDRPLLTPPKTKVEAKAQIEQMMQEHAVEMDALSRL